MRPTKYKPEMCDQAETYLTEYKKYGHTVPSLVGFASILGVSEKTLYNWSKDDDKPDFLQSVERIKDQQHLILLNKGLTGEFHSTITKLLLFNHGYSDKQQINDADGEPVKVYIQTHWDKSGDPVYEKHNPRGNK